MLGVVARVGQRQFYGIGSVCFFHIYRFVFVSPNDTLLSGIHTTFEAIKNALAAGEAGASMRLVGDSRAMVIAVDSSEFDVQRWASAMSEKGW